MIALTIFYLVVSVVVFFIIETQYAKKRKAEEDYKPTLKQKILSHLMIVFVSLLWFPELFAALLASIFEKKFTIFW